MNSKDYFNLSINEFLYTQEIYSKPLQNLLLENDAFYTSLLILLIIYATFSSGPNKIDQPNKIDKYIKLRFDIPLVKILFILIIIYFGAKDIRISLLLMIIFFIEIEKVHVEEVNGELIALIVNDASLNERLQKLDKK
jgi:hypothetical protein